MNPCAIDYAATRSARQAHQAIAVLHSIATSQIKWLAESHGACPHASDENAQRLTVVVDRAEKRGHGPRPRCPQDCGSRD